MSDYDPNRTTVVTSSGAGGNGGLYFIVGMLVVAVLVGAYIMMGTPGLHSQVASAPSGGSSGQKVDVTVQQPANPAPATPATPAAPAKR
jgi:hypothetical protein